MVHHSEWMQNHPLIIHAIITFETIYISSIIIRYLDDLGVLFVRYEKLVLMVIPY